MGSHPSSLLRVPIDVPNRSGHNLSHSNSFTGTTGTLIPVACEELLPNDTVSLGSNFQVQLPPMATDFYGRVDFVLEAFFVPNRLCWGGWKDFITHPTQNPVYPEGTPVQAKPAQVPYVFVGTDNVGEPRLIPIAPNANPLMHYLDYGSMIQTAQDGEISVLPLIAYHRIWDDWYRDTRVQSPLFFPASSSSTSSIPGVVSSVPYRSTLNDGSAISVGFNYNFYDNVSLSDLRQRNWVKDYFTSASPLPQAGGASEVKFDVNTATETGAFSIATLRSANSLQMWMERNGIAGYRYSDQIHAQFGIYPADAIMDRCLYLGRNVSTVYNKSVYSTVDASSDTGGVLGTKGANSQVLGEGSIVKKFTASEHGFLMILASLVPRPVYGTGAERRNYRVKVGDFAFPLLAGMGDQAILARELDGRSSSTNTFGYTDLYAEYKFRNDKIHGYLADGYNLSNFAIQRSFLTPPGINSAFLQIPKSYLDQVQAVATSATGYTYWAEVFFSYSKISTIPAYSQPTLENLDYAHKEYISRGGKRL